MDDVNTSVLVPLLLLLVPSLASVSRQTELIEIANRADPEVHLADWGDLEKVFRPLFRMTLLPSEALSSQEDHEISGQRPKLGRFNHIHGFNTLLLGSTLVLIMISENGLLGVILMFLVGILWIVLPILEVNEYDLMMKQFRSEDSIKSISFHIFTTGVLCIFSMPLAYHDMSGYPPLYIIFLFSIYSITSIVIIGNTFQRLLWDEIEILRRRDREHSHIYQY